MKLSVIVATHNEEANIGKCLDAIKGIADEMIVADGESTDRTVEIAKAKGAMVLHMTNKKMFHINKEEARKKAKGDWILFLDADEIVTPELAKEIKLVLADVYHPATLNKQFAKHMRFIETRDGIKYSSQLPINGYFIARKNYFLGRYLMHSGVYPDGVIRLVRKDKAFWPCKDVHEQMSVDGGVSWLTEPMIHMADPTFSRYMERANRYTTLTADSLSKTKTGKDFFTIVNFMLWKPTITFLFLFFRHKGFMDGFSGFVWSLMSGLHYAMAYLKFLGADNFSK
ncbi:MAG TPA: glycosyltransferase family 2 protein [Patescibacteria group bacterium]|nr:glycosyltransferase family 2 protein [Patescibacteria group bacterium]